MIKFGIIGTRYIVYYTNKYVVTTIYNQCMINDYDYSGYSRHFYFISNVVRNYRNS